MVNMVVDPEKRLLRAVPPHDWRIFVKKSILFFPGLAAVVVCATIMASAQDFKLKTRSSVAGRSFDSATLIKGARQRTEANGAVTITQCDLKRTIHINDAKKRYYIEPLSSGDETTTPSAPPSRGKARKGGVVTVYLEITDTGERKEFFGLTAHRIVTRQRIEPGPGACQEEKAELTIDGWYVDLSAQFSCDEGRPPMAFAGMADGGGCEDQYKIVRKGSGRLGYPVLTTMKFGGGGDDGDNAAMAGMMSFKTEVVELSRAPLADAMFDIPAGYTQVNSMNELR